MMSRTTWIVHVTTLLIILGLFPIDAPSQLQYTDSWNVLAGSVEAIDTKNRAIELDVRSGAKTSAVKWGESVAFSTSQLELQAKAKPTTLKLIFGDDLKVWKLRGSRLTADSLSSLEPGTAVIIELQEGQSWPREGMTYQRLAAIHVILLQACIEDSCRKAKCQGKVDCKEKECDCSKPK